MHLGHVHAAQLVKAGIHRVGDRRLGSDQFQREFAGRRECGQHIRRVGVGNPWHVCLGHRAGSVIILGQVMAGQGEQEKIM